jgi:hypothetical protein
VVKFLLNKTNLILQDTIQVATNWYAVSNGNKVLLWGSRLDHSQDIEIIRFGLLAMLQCSWATIVRHKPDLLPEDWVAYRDCSIHKQLRKDVTYKGRAKVLKVGKAPKISTTAEWFEPDPVTGTIATSY